MVMITDYIIIALLIVMTVVLFILEIFFLPGITVAGIGGILFALGAVYYAYTLFGAIGAVVTLAVGIALVACAFFYFLRSKAWSKIALNTNIDSKITSKTALIQVGDRGITLSRLAPMGQIRINGETVEAKAEDELIDEGVTVEVTAVHPTNVTIRRA